MKATAASPVCAVCGNATGTIFQGDDRVICLGCACGVSSLESARPHAATDQRLAVAGELLDSAVPLWILQLQRLDDAAFALTWRRWLDEAEPAGVFSEALPVGGTKGHVASAFNALARSLAALAFVPGGVPFAGRRWEARRAPTPCPVNDNDTEAPHGEAC